MSYIIYFNKSAIEKPDTGTTAQAKIVKIDAIINTLLDAQLEFAADPNKQEYGYEDGQTRVKMVYRDLNAVIAAIEGWERLKGLYINRINGRMIRLADLRAFPNFGWF